MLIYSTVMLFRSKFDEVFDVITEWLSEKARVPFPELKQGLSTDHDWSRSTAASKIISTRFIASNARWQSIEFTHPDNVVNGRQWKTELGLKQLGNQRVQVTLIVSISDVSPLVDRKVVITRPRIVPLLLERCTPSSRTPGAVIKRIDTRDAKVLRYLITAPQRDRPIVVISPQLDGQYLVDISEEGKLFSFLRGISDIVIINPNADTFEISSIVGKQYVPYHGAVNLVYPPVNQGASRSISNFLLKPDDIKLIQSSVDHQLEQFLLAKIAHRMNLPNSWKHINRERVKDERRQKDLRDKERVSSHTGDTRDYINYLLAEIDVLSERERILTQKEADLQEDLLSKTIELQDKENEIGDLRRTNDELRIALQHAQAKRSNGELPDQLRQILIEALAGTAEIASLLKLFATIFSDRLLVLDQAFSSAEDSRNFRYVSQVQDLLLKLVTNYWEALMDGKGDTEAKAIFGDKFAAKESKTVANNSRARDLRTFVYKGKPIEMMRHLKIGVKDNASDTIRIHFYWDSEDKKIVVGHCGPHLSQK